MMPYFRVSCRFFHMGGSSFKFQGFYLYDLSALASMATFAKLFKVGRTLRAGLHYDGEGLRSVKNAWPIHGYMRQMVDVPEKN